MAAACALAAGGTPASAIERHYERVTPADKGSMDVMDYSEYLNRLDYADRAQASVAGGAVTYMAQGSFAGATGGAANVYLSRRDASGWSTTGLSHPVSMTPYPLVRTPDLSRVLVASTGAAMLAPGATALGWSLYARDLPGSQHETVSLNGAEDGGSTMYYNGGSRDLSHVVFSEINTTHIRTADAVAGVENLYEWHHGSLRLVSVLPDGTPAPNGAITGGYDIVNDANPYNAVSEDGSRIVFSTPDRRLYVRIDGTSTVEVARSRKATPDAQQPAHYVGASTDGSKVVFTTAEQLVEDDTDASYDIYRYDVDTDGLVRLTQGGDAFFAYGISDDAETIYFGGIGDFGDPGAPPPADFNLFVLRDGEVSYWGRPGGGFLGDSARIRNGSGYSSRVSKDGSQFAFLSSFQLTDAATGGFEQAYHYDAEADKLVCVSCPASGESVAGQAFMSKAMFTGQLAGDAVAFQHSLSDDGERLFFTSPNRLAANDVDSYRDVYEFADGKTTLISGNGGSHAYFLDASADGEEVFISTRDRLVDEDADDLTDVYSVRPGSDVPRAPRLAPECDGDGCQGGVRGATRSARIGSTGGGRGDAPAQARRALTLKALTSKQRAALARGARVRLAVKVNGRARVTVVGHSRIDGHRRKVLAATRIAERRGSVLLPIRLGGAGRAWLAEKGRLRIALSVSVRGASPVRTTLRLERKR